MRKVIAIPFVVLLATIAHGQGTWSTLNIPSSARYDDIYFVNDSVGWAAGGPTGWIRKTVNGGATWNLQFTSPSYLRSIEFINADTGFCGSLNGELYRTHNGGTTWIDVSGSITPSPPGICGLSAPSPNTIYGTGLWASPAYVVKSTDGGDSWSYIDMSAHATALVDIHFLSADTGFVTGTASPASDGGIILHTTDGGTTWQPKHLTGLASDIVWKIQRLDADRWYASVYSEPVNDDTRLLSSTDGGQTWSTTVVSNSYTYVEVVGFLDSLRGWIGGDNSLWGTTDGGASWSQEPVGSNYNRFFRLNDSLAYMSGARIYKYTVDAPTAIISSEPVPHYHALVVEPTITDGRITISIRLDRSTIADLSLFGSDGALVEQLLHRHAVQGEHRFTTDLSRHTGSTFVVVLKTNEGMRYQKVVVK
ncbi:MAG: hypothetical protein KA175_00675 [Flavobacteriales bacterium]|nr:hypothetical protein [Flavobacteriales bacterium]MBP6696096.1 hypothetical protein [Flavobacteriales bacterium]